MVTFQKFIILSEKKWITDHDHVKTSLKTRKSLVKPLEDEAREGADLKKFQTRTGGGIQGIHGYPSLETTIHQVIS
jgi:hypothetical protein